MKKEKILYVDDEEINLQLFEINLQKWYVVLTAENADKGLEILANHLDIRAVVSDMKMPGKNGLEFITMAKKQYPWLSYFILTGYEITEEIQTALSDGLISKYFRKPFDLGEIEKELKIALDRK